MGLPIETLQGIRALGLLADPRVEEALETIGRDRWLPASLVKVAGVDAPLPGSLPCRGVTVPSPRLVALAVELLGVDEEHRVLVAGSRGAYPASVLAEIGCDVTLYDPGAGPPSPPGVRIVGEPPIGPFDRVLVLEPAPADVEALARPLANGGSLLHIRDMSSGRVTRYDRFGTLDRVRLDSTPVEASWADSIHDVVSLEAMQNRALVGRPQDRAEVGVDRAIASMFDELMRAEDGPHTHGGRALFALGYLAQAANDLFGAYELYRASAQVWETSEALTFAGWVLAIQDMHRRAIQVCKEAIRADPTLGNPYNDIGAYLIEIGDPKEALPWLDLAMDAPRYDSRWFPHLNKGRALLLLGKRAEATDEFETALRLNPDEPVARSMLDRLEGR